jgi:hypothetical protein
MKCTVQKGLALVISWCLIPMGVPAGYALQQQAPEALKQGAAQLDQLVAPIALYPDSLIAQILAAATYPGQIVEAQKWMQKNKGVAGAQLAKEVNKQSWDASVKALTQFPAVLANMNQNLAWTSELGDAYINQPQQLTQAIQTMRQRAMQAGNLKSTPQQNVETQGNTIVIQPANADMVYVPQYDPWVVYGAPLAVFPGWYPYPGLFLTGPGIGFGLGFGIGLFAGYGWGWNNWGYDWHGGGRVVYNHHTYVSHSRTIVNRNRAHAARPANRATGSASRMAAARRGTHAAAGRHGAAARESASRAMSPHAAAQMHSHGAMAKGSANRYSGHGAMGGGHAFHGGGFHGGGFHGGGFHGGGFHGGGGHGGGGHGGGHR